MFGWLREARSDAKMVQAGWSGAMALPRVLELSGDGELVCRPLDTITSLRGKTETLKGEGQAGETVYRSRLEISVRFPDDPPEWSGILLEFGETADEAIRIGYESQAHEVVVDCRKTGGLISRVPLKPGPDELWLRIFLDGSVLEVFVNDRIPISHRFYAQKPDQLRLRLQGGAQAQVWRLTKE
jgi:beta-fructofuranosidase